MAGVAPAQAAPQSIATGVALAIAGSIAFSGKAIIVKLAYRYPGVDAVSLIMLRMLMALPFFLGLVWWAGYRARKAGAVVVPLTSKDKLGIVGLGITGYYLASYLDFAGLAYISASLERLILYLNPTLVVLLGVALYGKKVSLPQAAGMALSYGGVLLVFGHEVSFAGGNAALGAALVLGSAISYALYLSYSGELVQRLGSLRLVGLATSVACVLCIAQFVILRPLDTAFAVAPEVLWLSLLNATACTVVPVMLVMMAIERIGSGLAAQVGMVGPMSTILMGVLLLDEPMNLWVIGGTILVLLGVYVVSTRR
ncbi:DMT family transporter [Rhodoferax sp. TBRC 17198]|uniref:DMT family transporter n=1 Tax=Rhodoferax potami TaxID=3068338 RepID=UPI0028BD9FB0|nr:DMT family transporter [Rhodoferax sp. TBRC 17198]MDT7522811.1 DMT family transporter [Rhodoferax sp. TBRC 17198]